MKTEHFLLCDFCAGNLDEKDCTTVSITIYGVRYEFHYHNRHRDDCMGRYFAQLRKMFPKEETATP